MLKPALMLGLAIAVAATTTRDGAVAQDGGGGCGGRLVEYVPFNVGGQQIGQLQLYYNASNGNNCAVMYHGGPSWGVLRDTGVIIARSNTRNGPYTQAAYQRANYRYQAGPIRAEGRNKCVYAGGGIDWNGQRHNRYTGFHCG